MLRFLISIVLVPASCFFAWVYVSDLALGASFHCNKASTQTEIAICANTELSALDSQLGRTFSVALSRSRNRIGIISEQRSWITERNEFCSNFTEQRVNFAKCLNYMIRKRIVELNQDNSPLPRQIHWGSRAGMHSTVVGSSGINSKNAKIFVEHQLQDAEAFCVEYGYNFSEKCILDGMQEATSLPKEITANCYTGNFSSLNGMEAHFLGRNMNFPSIPGGEYLIVVDGNILDGSSASGHDVALENFNALCPKFVH